MSSFKWCLSCAGRKARRRGAEQAPDAPAVPPPSPEASRCASGGGSDDSLERVLEHVAGCEPTYWRNRDADVDTPPTRRRLLSPDYSFAALDSDASASCKRRAMRFYRSPSMSSAHYLADFSRFPLFFSLTAQDLVANSNVQDAFVIAVEKQARERLERLSALKKIKPVDMTKLSQQVTPATLSTSKNAARYRSLASAKPPFLRDVSGIDARRRRHFRRPINNSCAPAPRSSRRGARKTGAARNADWRRFHVATLTTLISLSFCFAFLSSIAVQCRTAISLSFTFQLLRGIDGAAPCGSRFIHCVLF